MSKRTTITNGLRPLRYPVAILASLSFGDTMQNPESTSSAIICLSSVVLFIFFYFYRKIEFDEEKIYRIHGKREKAVPFTEIKSIKRSRMKVNSTRMWKVTFLDEAKEEKFFRFLEGTFQHNSTEEFIRAAEKVNPSIVV